MVHGQRTTTPPPHRRAGSLDHHPTEGLNHPFPGAKPSIDGPTENPRSYCTCLYLCKRPMAGAAKDWRSVAETAATLASCQQGAFPPEACRTFLQLVRLC